MKKIIQNKKYLICLIIALILISLIVVGVFLFNKDKEENIEKEEIKNNYIAYIKINPLIKIEYSQTCKNEKCSNPIVTKYELLNEDAKNIYKNINLIGTNSDLYDVINLISKTALENNIEFKEVEIYSNWNNLNNYINNLNTNNNKWTYIINIRDKENLEKISSSLEENKILYNVLFDTDGGSEINPQTIEKGNKVSQPSDPVKKGYKFIEWQLEDKKFDFNEEINSDIKLIAKWEKLEDSNNTDDNKNNVIDNNNTKNNESSNDNSNNNNQEKLAINLNDNVQYYISTMNISCSSYVYVNPVCNNKSLNELKAMYPDYNKDLDEEILSAKEEFETDAEYDAWLNEYMNNKLIVGRYSNYSTGWTYFPSCDDANIPNNYLNELRKTQGMYTGNQSGPRFEFSYINFKDNTYRQYETDLDYSKYGLVEDGGCGGEGIGNIDYSILDEATCTKFNLPCDRW